MWCCGAVGKLAAARWVVAVVAALMLLTWLATTVAVWWDTRTITATRLEKAELQASVADLKANQESLIKAGMLAKLQYCAPDHRP